VWTDANGKTSLYCTWSCIPVYFYHRDEEHDYMANTKTQQMTLKGIPGIPEYYGLQVPTCEHAFQLPKFRNMSKCKLGEYLSMTGKEVAIHARNKGVAPSGWYNGGNITHMYNCVLQKFSGSGDLKRDLLGTGQRYIAEHPDPGGDAYWGDGGDGKGQNNLGKVLMKVRTYLRSQLS
jgi:ribA/ribD-fused uncharacterized protein